MANIKVIFEHSVAVDLLTGGICIDVGCRGFGFSVEMHKLGCHVIAFDLEPMEHPKEIRFLDIAIGPETKDGYYVDTKDKQAKYLSDSGKPVSVWGINELYKSLIGELDVLKLDCEGEEYRILSAENFQPIPRQISVEFHMHAHRALHDQYYDKCMENLLKYYEPVQHELTQAHGAGENYWDSLFVRRDLIK